MDSVWELALGLYPRPTVNTCEPLLFAANLCLQWVSVQARSELPDGVHSCFRRTVFYLGRGHIRNHGGLPEPWESLGVEEKLGSGGGRRVIIIVIESSFRRRRRRGNGGRCKGVPGRPLHSTARGRPSECKVHLYAARLPSPAHAPHPLGGRWQNGGTRSVWAVRSGL